MTETDLTAATRTPYVPPGHPVRRFVIALVVVAGLSGALLWSGLASPRVAVHIRSVSAPGASPRAHELTLRNDGPLTLDVLAVRPHSVEVRVLDFGGAALPAGRSFAVRLEEIDPGPYECDAHLEIDVRTALGLVRTIDFAPFAVRLGCPAG